MADDSDFDERREALKARVQAQIEASKEAKLERQQNASEELVVDESDLNDAIAQANEEFNEHMASMENANASQLRTLAASLILVGSILGMASGGLILQGNPADLINAFSVIGNDESVDVSGIVLEPDGSAVADVNVELMNVDSGEVIGLTTTDSNGYFWFKSIDVTELQLTFTLDGHTTVERIFIPDGAQIKPITLREGTGTVVENEIVSRDGWNTENAVALSTAVGVLTVLTGLIGVQSAVEARRAKRYRRTQYLAGLALFSRGLIIFGPALILAGMMLLMKSRDQFSDVGGE
ncbi:MAG: carboxypeptidase-like regulatory domain-containing protein [Candidatus Poseidoniaceae archaeon]|nr:carboxypeptidase-like regulatory domain-containing protein [Candidatus Poseidoniaceae archaeon]HII22282.1 carboxypeptidase regulatory-like domain-containing protein [Candidatus Poseidoniaceae archaeon]